MDSPHPPRASTLDDKDRAFGIPQVQLEDQESPRFWPATRKWICTSILVLMTAMIAFCSSIYTAAIPSITEEYGCSSIVATLGITTFLLGFGSGPLLFAPLSEIWGRNKIFRVVLGLFVLVQIGCALAPNVASMIVFRCLAGFFGSPAVTNSGGSITDIWPQDNRSVPLALFSAASFLGPVLAPTVGGFICQYTSWRWNFWLVLIISGVCYVAMFIFLPETYAPKLLLDKKRRDPGYSPADHPPVMELLRTSLMRPWLMLFTEPILFLLSLYMAFVYGILYLDFTAYPVVYRDTWGWSAGIAGLSFLGICLGMAVATLLSPYLNCVQRIYIRRLGGPYPETRLPHLIVISWLIPISLFWFGWTAAPPTHWICGIMAGIPFGFGLIFMFLGITSYLTDCYGTFGASALAANAVLRSIFGAVFPLFATNMYQSLGVPWATSVLAFVSLMMAPLPWVFYHFGPRIRARSKYHLKTRDDFLSGDTERRRECTEKIRHACRTLGFFQLIKHPISLSLQREMFKLSREFFALPLEEKLKLDKSQNDHNRGYEVMYGQMVQKTTNPDLKEGYYVSRDIPVDHSQSVSKESTHGTNFWPESLSSHFQETCMDYFNQVSDLAEKVMQAIAISLDYDEHYFHEFCTEPMAFYKLLHYPPQPDEAHPPQRGIGAHRDFGVITLLLQGDVPGLEQWTNDVYISNVHRVVNRSSVARYSIPFHYNGNPEFIIRCIESCREKADDEKYAPISVNDYVRQKYKNVDGRAGIGSVAEALRNQMLVQG
ncbi:putative MFS transporter [Aspergillus aurantiobrunneus]